MVQHGSWEWLLEGFRFELETRVKAKTIVYYRDHLGGFVKWAKNGGQVASPNLLTKRDIQSFLLQLTSDTTITVGNRTRKLVHRSERTRWPYYRCLRRFFAWAVGEGYLLQNPLEGIKLSAPKAPPIEPYAPEQIDRMLKVLDFDWQHAVTARQKMLAARDRAVLLLFLESGLRLGELTGLRVGDIDPARQRAVVRHGKMDKGRLVGFGVETKKALWRYLGLRPADGDTDAVWLTEEGRPLGQGGVSEIIRRLKRDAGLKDVTGSVHKLRHTFATCYLRHTKDMKSCRILLGHSTLAMTERYTQFIDAEDALQAYDGQGPLDWMKSAAK